jgi:hypothetical protein
MSLLLNAGFIFEIIAFNSNRISKHPTCRGQMLEYCCFRRCSGPSNQQCINRFLLAFRYVWWCAPIPLAQLSISIIAVASGNPMCIKVADLLFLLICLGIGVFILSLRMILFDGQLAIRYVADNTLTQDQLLRDLRVLITAAIICLFLALLPNVFLFSVKVIGGLPLECDMFIGIVLIIDGALAPLHILFNALLASGYIRKAVRWFNSNVRDGAMCYCCQYIDDHCCSNWCSYVWCCPDDGVEVPNANAGPRTSAPSANVSNL